MTASAIIIAGCPNSFLPYKLHEPHIAKYVGGRPAYEGVDWLDLPQDKEAFSSSMEMLQALETDDQKAAIALYLSEAFKTECPPVLVIPDLLSHTVPENQTLEIFELLKHANITLIRFAGHLNLEQDHQQQAILEKIRASISVTFGNQIEISTLTLSPNEPIYQAMYINDLSWKYADQMLQKLNRDLYDINKSKLAYAIAEYFNNLSRNGILPKKANDAAIISLLETHLFDRTPAASGVNI